MTHVKICGITNLEDAVGAVEAGADTLGFNFYEKSPRYITPTVAKKIIAELPGEISTIGVFVNSGLAGMESVLSDISLDFIQLHGDEDPEFVRQVKVLTGAKVIKAFRVSAQFQPTVASDYETELFLLDAYSRGFGGSGETFNWDTAIKFKEFAAQFYLAGGLTPGNVAEAIRKTTPFGVDVCSGVESVKGRKDPFKMKAFVRNAKNAL